MKQFRKERFEDFYNKNHGEDNRKYILNHDEITIIGEKELLAKIFHYIDIENDSSVQDYSYYTKKFSTCPYSMVNLFNEFREGSGDSMKITSTESINLSELLGHDTDLNFDKMKTLSYEEIQKIEADEDEDAWIIWDLILLLKKD